MTINRALFSSEKETHETPQWLFDELNKQFEFDVDVCALPESAKCERYFTPTDNAFTKVWNGCCWMNPPYGRKISEWMIYAAEQSSQNGSTIVCLVPSRTDTKWFHNALENEPAVMFIKRRLKFGNAKALAPFPSMIMVFSSNAKLAQEKLLNTNIDGWVAL